MFEVVPSLNIELQGTISLKVLAHSLSIILLLNVVLR